VSNVVRLPVRPVHGRLLTKKQLAAELGRSTRWIELRMREGLPVVPRSTAMEHARFELDAVRTWMDGRGSARQPSLEERVGQLERQVNTLTAELQRRAT
jgi:hypothetical protein